MRRTLETLLPLACVSAIASGCAVTRADRNLVITEVAKDQVELYLDEPADRALLLDEGMLLTVTSSSGNSASVNFKAFDDTLPGGGFLILWEGGGYDGPPVREDYSGGQQGAVPGLKVSKRFFDELDEFPSEVRLHGKHSRTTGIIVVFPRITEDRLDDVVRFGTPEGVRPQTGGQFLATGALGFPTGSVSLQRRWDSGAPVDLDQEDDWKHYGESLGVPTP